MTQICNRIIEMPENDNEAKNSCMKSGSHAMLQALAETLLMTVQAEQAGEYDYSLARARTAAQYFSQAIKFYNSALTIVSPFKVSGEAMNWVAGFDFHRFYMTRVSERIMPARPDLWQLIEAWTLQGKPEQSTIHLRDLLSKTRDRITSYIDDEHRGVNLIEHLRTISIHAIEAQTFAIMMATLNDVQPLNSEWTNVATMPMVNSRVVKGGSDDASL